MKDNGKINMISFHCYSAREGQSDVVTAVIFVYAKCSGEKEINSGSAEERSDKMHAHHFSLPIET